MCVSGFSSWWTDKTNLAQTCVTPFPLKPDRTRTRKTGTEQDILNVKVIVREQSRETNTIEVQMINTTWNWDQTAASNTSALKCIRCPCLSSAWPMFLTDHSKSHALVNLEYVMRYAVYWPSSSCSEIASRRGNWIKNTFYWFKLIRRVRKYMLNNHTYHMCIIYIYVYIFIYCNNCLMQTIPRECM